MEQCKREVVIDQSSKPRTFLSSAEPGLSARRLVNVFKSSVSKLFKYCTIRIVAVYVIMTYVHNYVVYKRSPELNVLDGR